MKHTILSFTAVLALGVLWCTAPALAGEHPEHPTTKTEAAAESGGLLDGKTFKGEIGKKGEEKGDPDDFVFKDGTFLSTACREYGFGEASYTATKKGEKIQFTAEVKNDKGETLSWKGVARGKRFRGTAVYQKGEGTTEYWFKGALKAAESDKKSEHPEHPKSDKKSEHPEHPK